MTNKDCEHLEWIYQRMIHVHGENPNYDYMLKFRQMLDGKSKSQRTPPLPPKGPEGRNIHSYFGFEL